MHVTVILVIMKLVLCVGGSNPSVCTCSFRIFSCQCQYIYGDVSFNNDSLYHIYQYVNLCYFLIQLEDMKVILLCMFFWNLYAAEFSKKLCYVLDSYTFNF